MPDLSHTAIQDWLTRHGSATTDDWIAPSVGAADDEPDVLPSVLRLGEALDDARHTDADCANRLLTDRSTAGRLGAVLAGFGGGRRMRLLHWLADPDDAGSPKVVQAILGPETHGPGAALRQWLLDLERRELLQRLFQPERLQALLAACRTATAQEHTP